MVSGEVERKDYNIYILPQRTAKKAPIQIKRDIASHNYPDM